MTQIKSSPQNSCNYQSIAVPSVDLPRVFPNTRMRVAQVDDDCGDDDDSK
ncbi:hypothetical protein QYS62_004924 [Fusarium acuminatum]|uniref:Uncharacterized protein n=1 Tax=Fusarium acuminatum TaxID=5515 RepID=A0ABZ2WTR9_9HYPO